MTTTCGCHVEKSQALAGCDVSVRAYTAGMASGEAPATP
jgi:hypothetical protein